MVVTFFGFCVCWKGSENGIYRELVYAGDNLAAGWARIDVSGTDVIGEFGKLAKTNNSIIIPTNLADIAGMIKSATTVIQQQAVAE